MWHLGCGLLAVTDAVVPACSLHLVTKRNLSAALLHPVELHLSAGLLIICKITQLLFPTLGSSQGGFAEGIKPLAAEAQL